jgi:outer membrane protein assembly factor BamB
MAQQSGSGFDDYSVDIADVSIKKVKKFDRVWRVGVGGSIANSLILHEGVIHFGCADKYVYAVDPIDGKLRWKFRTEGSIIEGSGKMHDGVFYIGSYDRNMYAISAEDGKLIWKFTTQGQVASIPACCEGKVYFGSRDQNVYALDAGTGRLLWKYRTFGGIISEPAIVGNKLLIGSYDRFLYCLDKDTGRLIWKLETQGEIHNANAFAVRDGVAYIGSFDDCLRAVEVESGRVLWKVRLGQYGSCVAPVLHGDMILYSSRNGTMYAVDMQGKLLWKFFTREVIGIPCIHDGRIYVGSCDFCMHCLDLDGRELWRYKTDGYVWYKTVKIGRRLYFPSWDCFLYCFDTETRQVLWKFRTSGSPSPLPPPYEAFELELSIPEAMAEEERKKAYDLDMSGAEDDAGRFYKSTITYQVRTQYQEKGKYQIDSDEEAF